MMQNNNGTTMHDDNSSPARLGRVAQWTSILLAALFLGAGVTGCEQDGPMEEAGEEIDNAVDDAGDELEDAADEVEDEIE